MTGTAGNDSHPAWSPDGEWIVFTSARGGFKDEAALHPFNPQPYGDLYVMRADGSDVRTLTDNQFEDGTPTWVPTGRTSASLAAGGMGIVYLARDAQLDATSPSRCCRPISPTPGRRGLSHPHIVPIHRVGTARGFVFFVMSYVEGETLGERLRTRGPLPG